LQARAQRTRVNKIISWKNGYIICKNQWILA